jgi:hypothetical protein
MSPFWDFECICSTTCLPRRERKGYWLIMFEPGCNTQLKLGRSLIHQQSIASSFVAFKNKNFKLEFSQSIVSLYTNGTYGDCRRPAKPILIRCSDIFQQSVIHNPISDLQDRARGRSGMDSRLRFDDSRREAERDGGRYGRGDHSPSRDGPDDQMFDTFRGRGSNAPFVAEFPPPPILMPVPGAG